MYVCFLYEYVRMYVCVCVYVCIYLHTYVHAFMQTYMHTALMLSRPKSTRQRPEFQDQDKFYLAKTRPKHKVKDQDTSVPDQDKTLGQITSIN